jgi:tetratricopeptide (TPR) repeat protein
LLVGWLWYLGMLVPMIGIMRVGQFVRADRYTYLSQIGLYLLLTWAAADLCAGWRHRRVVLGGCATIILVALIFCARVQASYWRNSESLWTHTLACTSDNAIAHNNLGDALLKKGSVDEAITHYQKALQIKPDYAAAHINLGNTLLQKGNVDEAITHYQKALQISPDDAAAHYNLGNALLQKRNVDEAITHYQKALQISPDDAAAHINLGNALIKKGSVDEAITHYQLALQIKPDYAEVHINLGNALLKKGSVDEAIVHYQKALQIKPDSAEVHLNLGNALLKKGSVDEAITHYQKALQIKPDSAKAQNNLAWVLATALQASLRNGHQAVELAQQANQLTGGENPIILRTLAAAYAEAGRFSDAQRSAQKAMALARAAGQSGLVEQLNGELKLYTAGLPFHQESK